MFVFANLTAKIENNYQLSIVYFQIFSTFAENYKNYDTHSR